MKHSYSRVVIPDLHSLHQDEAAVAACLRDVKEIRPREIVILGDLLDCGGTFSTHQRSYTNEMCESYDDDVRSANGFLDALITAAPDAEYHMLEGNHEQHVERWAARNFHSYKDAENFLECFGPQKVLELRHRNIRYYKRSEHYQGLSIPGTIKLGKCFFVHGISHSKHATQAHLERFGACVVHGHTHRSQSAVERTVSSDGHGAWCPGTLAKLQPLYRHTAPTSWSHGYGYQNVMPSGVFLHLNVPIIKGKSLLISTMRALSRKR